MTQREQVWITARDGTRLAADLYLPATSEPAPALLEALPYRKDDLTADSHADDYIRLCTEGGFAVCRLDVRGTGSSAGRATDEYPLTELDDLADVIAWLADRPWCNGRVGMFGYSYSGFNSLQLACERPPGLGAICAIYATDDRYTDDVHYMGGALRAIDLVDYCHYMVPMNALPPVPAVWGDGWRDEWSARIAEHEPWLLLWMEHQLDDAYWRHGSVRPDYERIACPTMIVAGWADGYRNNTFRTFERLQCETELLIGPWSHMSPSASLPGPHIDLVPEMISFFGRSLRDDVAEARPPIRVFVRHATKPEPDRELIDGEWRYETEWPPARLTELTLHDGRRRSLVTRADTGSAAWNSCAGALPWGQPIDQRSDDAWSLSTDWPVAAATEILGHVVVKGTVTSDHEVAYLSVKLNDVWPDGTSALVARGLLNLTHRVDPPQPLVPGEPYDVEVEMEATSWVFPVGHSIRLSVAGTDWPNTWVPPGAVTLTVESLQMQLPVLPPGGGGVPQFADVPTPIRESPADVTWDVSHDVLGRVSTVSTKYGGTYDTRNDGRMTDHYEGFATVPITDPAHASAGGTVRFAIDWPEASVLVESRLLVQSNETEYSVEIALDASEAGTLVGQRRWSRTFPRRLA
ncbi:MAG TPA: CocE/NonD family hydrolase [Ilumatobacteraceae bacterium]